MRRSSPAVLLEAEPAPIGRAVASVAGSLVLAGGLFFGLAKTHESAPPDAPPGFDDLEAAVAPVDLPPPPPRRELTAPVPIGTPFHFPLESVQDAAVRIQVEPAPVRPIDVSAPLARPGISARFNLAAASLVPRETVTADVDRIYDRSEVDQRPVVVYRKKPNVTRDHLARVPNRRVMLMFVVNKNGQVENVHLLQSSQDVAYDELLLEAIADWEFKPAIRKGKTVRSWVQLPVTVRYQAGTPFEAR